jgi:hypothetical protein
MTMQVSETKGEEVAIRSRNIEIIQDFILRIATSSLT